MTETIWAVLGWTAAALAVGAAAWCFFGDRLRRRRRPVRRCPKCWYDLSHTPGRRCSECGHTAARERQLFRTRRGWRWLAIALLLGVASHLAFRAPAIGQRGWVAAVPTKAIILTLPVLRPDLATCADIVRFNRQTETTWREQILLELLLQRIATDRLDRIDGFLLSRICRSLRPDLFDDYDPWPTTLDMVLGTMRWAGDQKTQFVRPRRDGTIIESVALTTRRAWPEGQTVLARIESIGGGASRGPLRVIAHQACSASGNVSWRYVDERMPIPTCTFMPPDEVLFDDVVAIGVARRGETSLTFHCIVQELHPDMMTNAGRWATIFETQTEVRFDVVDSIDDLLEPASMPSITTHLSRSWWPRLIRDAYVSPSEQAPYAIDARLETGLETVAGWMGDDAAFGVVFEVLDGERIVALGEACFFNKTVYQERWLTPLRGIVPLTVLDENALKRIAAGSSPGRLRVRGDQAVALRHFDARRYWEGEVVVPLRIR